MLKTKKAPAFATRGASQGSVQKLAGLNSIDNSETINQRQVLAIRRRFAASPELAATIAFLAFANGTEARI